MKRHRLGDKAPSSLAPVSTRHTALPITSKLLNASEKVLSVRPLTLLLDFIFAPAIERLALVEDAFVSLPIVRSLEAYGISSSYASVLTVLAAVWQLKRALRRQRDLTLLVLSTVIPVWQTLGTPSNSTKPSRVEAFWALFALMQGFEATRVHPHPIIDSETPLPPSASLSDRLRPLARMAVRLQRVVQQRILKVEPSPLPALPTPFPQPSPFYTASLVPSTSHLPRLALSLRTFGTSWPLIKLLVLWTLTLNDFSLANRLLSPFRSPRPRPPGRRIVTIVTVQDPPTVEDRSRPPSPPKTPDLERSDGGYIVEAAGSDLGEAHSIWAKGYEASSVS